MSRGDIQAGGSKELHSKAETSQKSKIVNIRENIDTCKLPHKLQEQQTDIQKQSEQLQDTHSPDTFRRWYLYRGRGGSGCHMMGR